MTALESIRADVIKGAHLLDPLLALAVMAQKLTGVGGGTAAQALAMIDAAVKALESAAAGSATSEQATAEIAAFQAQIAENNAAADAALAARFPGPLPP